MPQAVATVIGALGGPLGIGPAAVANAVGIPLSGGIIGNALGFGPKGDKPNTAEREIKSATPPRVYLYGKRRLFGSSMLFETAADGSTADVWAFLDGRANAITAVYLNDEAYTLAGGFITAGEDGAYGGSKVRAGYNLGLDTETAFAPVVAALPGIWTASHRGDGIVSAYLIKESVKDKDFLKRYPQGDNVTMSLAIEGQLCPDPREAGHDFDDPSTWTYTENAALHTLHYYLVRRGYDYATRIEPVVDLWIAAADDCDVAMALDAGGTEPRYRGCVTYDSTKLPGDVLSELLACFDGWTAPDENGCIRVYSGRLYEPTVAIGPEQIVAYSHQSFVEDENVVNELVVQYVSAEHDFATVEGTAWRDEADISARGRVNSDSFSPQVPSHTQARRLAKRSAARRNAVNRGSVTTNFSGRAVLGQRYIALLIEEGGETFFDGIAEITGLERDYDTGGVTFDWVEADPAIDEWDESSEDGTSAPPPDHVPPTDLVAPAIDTAEPSFDADGVRLTLTVDSPDRDDLTWFAHWRIEGEPTWGGDLEFSDVDPGASVVIVTDFVPTDATVEVEVAYKVGDGRMSPWSDPASVDTGSDGEAVVDYDGGDATTEVMP